MLHLALTPDLNVTGKCFANKKEVKLKRKMIDNPYRRQLHDKTEVVDLPGLKPLGAASVWAAAEV